MSEDHDSFRRREEARLSSSHRDERDSHRDTDRQRDRDTRRRSRSRSPYRRNEDDHKLPRDRPSREEGDDRGSERTRRDDRYRIRSRSRSRDRDRDRNRERDRSRDRDRERERRKRRDSRSSDTSSSSESSDSEDERRRRKRKERRKEEKEERRRRKERRKAKKDKKKGSGTAAVTMQWGKYGILTESDIVKKDSEFRAWLVEERMINPETISKDRTRKEFGTFMEDYNTATLPHEKYYDMARYDKRMNMIRSGQTLPDDAEQYDPMADIKAHKSHVKSQTVQKETSFSRREIEELRRVESERIEVTKRRQMGLDVPKSLGVRTEEVDIPDFS